MTHATATSWQVSAASPGLTGRAGWNRTACLARAWPVSWGYTTRAMRLEHSS